MKKILESKKIIWDVTKNYYDYPDFIKKEFLKLSIKNRSKFVNWLSEVSKKYSEDINWWFKTPSSRDSNKSELYKNIIILKILKKKNIVKKIQNLVLDSNSLFQSIIKNNLLKKKNVFIKSKREFVFFKNLKSIIFSLFIFFLSKLKKKTKLKNYSNITLIDTYLDHRLFTTDIVYGDLNKQFSKLKKKNVFFLVNFLQSRNLFNILKNIFFLLDKNYILKEQFIDFHKYIYLIINTYFSKIKFCKINRYDNLDLSIILQGELESKKDFFSEFQSKVKLFFLNQMSISHIDLKKGISRFENQNVDRAFNYGFRIYFPKAQLLGYQGFLYYPHLENQNPIRVEDEARILPNKIIVTSKTLIQPRKEFYDKNVFLIGPSLVKQDIFKHKLIKKNNKFLLALSGIPFIDQILINWTTFVLSENLNIKILIKPHPTLPISKLCLNDLTKFEDRFKISNDNIKKLLLTSECIISSGPTSVFYESLIYSCKVLMLSLSYHDYLTIKKIKFLKNKIYYLYTKQELLSKLTSLQKKKHKVINNSFKNIFYTKLNKKNINFFTN